MPIDISKINPRGKLKHLIAKDMFEEDAKQVFSAKTGNYIGTIREGQEVELTEDPQEAIIKTEEQNPNQLTFNF